MRQNQIKKLLLIITLLIPSFAFAGIARLSDRSDVQQFIKNMVVTYNFNGPALANLFNQVNIRYDILKSIKRPSESSPWFRYRTLFITEKRVNQGVAFWNAHAKTLAYAQNKYGVPASVIVAIIGVETNYGEVKGHYRVIDTLTTLAFNYPPRQKFFRSELEQFLLLSREHNLNPLTVNGSYAGAIGTPQFMPSTYRRLAVSHNGHTKPDLINNTDDAIISVANYFKNYGWQPNQPIAIAANIQNDGYKNFVNSGLKPQYKLSQLTAHGVKPKESAPLSTPVNLIQLQGSNNYQYWIGFNNLYVIAAYNPRINYAMAVYELGKEIEKKRGYLIAPVTQVATNPSSPMAIKNTQVGQAKPTANTAQE